jgi:hypothetical protein
MYQRKLLGSSAMLLLLTMEDDHQLNPVAEDVPY